MLRHSMAERYLFRSQQTHRAEGQLPEGAWEAMNVKDMLPGILQ